MYEYVGIVKLMRVMSIEVLFVFYEQTHRKTKLVITENNISSISAFTRNTESAIVSF